MLHFIGHLSDDLIQFHVVCILKRFLLCGLQIDVNSFLIAVTHFQVVLLSLQACSPKSKDFFLKVNRRVLY